MAVKIVLSDFFWLGCVANITESSGGKWVYFSSLVWWYGEILTPYLLSASVLTDAIMSVRLRIPKRYGKTLFQHIPSKSSKRRRLSKGRDLHRPLFIKQRVASGGGSSWTVHDLSRLPTVLGSYFKPFATYVFFYCVGILSD